MPRYKKSQEERLREQLKLYPSLPDDAFISDTLLMALWDCSRSTIKRMEQDGTLPPAEYAGKHRMGRRKRWVRVLGGAPA